MKQHQYEAIITCIQYGAPALANELIKAFNQVMENSNELINAKLKVEEEARKAKEEAARKAKNEQVAKEANLSISKKK